MWLRAAVLAVAMAMFTGRVQGKAVDVIGLSGDNTRHGVISLYGAHGEASKVGSAANVEVSKYHVDTLVWTRFAHTNVDVEVRNNGLNGKRSITIPFAIPQDAMLTQFVVEAGGERFQARPMLRNDSNVPLNAGAATITARGAESFDVTMELVQGGVVRLHLEYEQLLARYRGRYRNVQQIWPGTLVKDMRVSVRIKEAIDISSDVKYFFTTELSDGVLSTVSQEALDKLGASSVLRSNVAGGGTREVAVVLQPSEQQQRALAALLARDTSFGGQLLVEYGVERYPPAGDIVMWDGYFVHFLASSSLTTLPKYAIFLLNSGKSMEGRRMTQLRGALKAMLGDLGQDDAFTVIVMSDFNKVWALSDPLSADCNAYGADQLAAALKLADNMVASGSTPMEAGMEQALQCAKAGPAGRQPVLFVLTDGTTDEPPASILNGTARWNVKGNDKRAAPVFTLAIGAADAGNDFLKELAARNGGSARQIVDSADASSQLKDFYASIPSLAFDSVIFDYEQADQGTVTQRDFRSFSRGSELVVAGKLLRSDVDLIGTVTGRNVAGNASFAVSVAAPPEWLPKHTNVRRLWAFLFTSQQLDSAVFDGRDSAAAKTATDMALKHSFVTTYTCLALEVFNLDPTSTPAAPTDADLPPTSTIPTSLTTTQVPPSATTAAAPSRPSPRPPGPDDGRDIRNDILIGSLDIEALSVNGPLVQINLR